MEDSTVAVSVIVLTYNHEKYISQALDSILEQKTSFPFEILIGDDCSYDQTIQKLLAYKSKFPEKIRVFLSGENQGATKNAYRLFQQARGKYLAACEGDDFWSDCEKLQKQVTFLEKHPELSGCTHNIVVVDQNGKPKRNQNIPWICNKAVYTPKDFKGIFLPGHASSIVRRNFFLQPEFDGSFFWKADTMIGDRTLAMLWVARGNFCRLDMAMSCYRQVFISDGDNVTSKKYYKNKNRTKEDFEYTLRLEKYAKEIFGGKFSFEYHKYQLFVSELIRCMIHPFSADSKLLKEIWSTLKHPFCAVSSIPYFLLQKTKNKLMRLID